MPEYLVSFCISYLIGSIPTAYLVVKKTSNVDIRTVGSGNVGGRNALEVTGKKRIGVAVVAIDILKGIIAVILATMLFHENVLTVGAAMVGSVTGHCYPAWLKFKGGRGLATAAGVFLVTCWIWVGVWLLLYFIASKTVKNVHVATVIALIVTPLLALIVPNETFARLIPEYFFPDQYIIAGVLPMIVCITRHVEPLKELYEAKTK
ncbi:MAG: glycerol-3-phosphate acyltransferase [Ignavibacteriales bacterium]|nr:glycerol-3-phosphate acyltransferase [Ignavibacteriales bacterium]